MTREEIEVNRYQELFDHMYDNHGLTLLIGEMDEIASICKRTL